MLPDIEAHGGKRRGSGRPSLYEEPVNRLSVQFPESLLYQIKKVAEREEISLSQAVVLIVASQFKMEPVTVSRIGKEKISAPVPTPKREICAPTQPECQYVLAGGSCSISAPLFVPALSGLGIEKIRARYCLVEADRLITSHNPLTGFGPRTGYPKDAQERDYRLPGEQAKVLTLAQGYEPAMIFSTAPGALDGLPVVTEDLVVLGGNGRAMATLLVYHGEGGVPSDTPKKFLEGNAIQWGFTQSDIDQYARPMVVRTIAREVDAKKMAEWSRRLNVSLSMQLDKTRLAVSRAKFFDVSSLDALEAMGEEETLAAFLGSTRSKPLVHSLQASGVIDARSAAQFLSGGLLNEQGRDLLADLLVAVIVPDADLIGALGPGLVGVLAKASPYLIQTADLQDYNLLPPLRKALRDRVTMKGADEPNVTNFLRQQGLFGVVAHVEGDPMAETLLRLVVTLEASPVKMAKLFRRYLSMAKAPGRGQSGLFATEMLSPIQTLEQAAKEAGAWK